MRSTWGPVWFVAEEFFGIGHLFGEDDWDFFNDFFNVLVAWSSSYVRVGCGKRAAVLTRVSVVDAAGVADP